MTYLTPSVCRYGTPTAASLSVYRNSRTGFELFSLIAAVVTKWYGVVPDASKNRPSMLAMQPSVQCGNSISAIVVPYLPFSLLFSHSARPQPLPGSSPSSAMVLTSARYSAYAPLSS